MKNEGRLAAALTAYILLASDLSFFSLTAPRLQVRFPLVTSFLLRAVIQLLSCTDYRHWNNLLKVVVRVFLNRTAGVLERQEWNAIVHTLSLGSPVSLANGSSQPSLISESSLPSTTSCLSSSNIFITFEMRQQDLWNLSTLLRTTHYEHSLHTTRSDECCPSLNLWTLPLPTILPQLFYFDYFWACRVRKMGD